MVRSLAIPVVENFYAKLEFKTEKCVKGKLVERQGRKATGSKVHIALMTAWPPRRFLYFTCASLVAGFFIPCRDYLFGMSWRYVCIETDSQMGEDCELCKISRNFGT